MNSIDINNKNSKVFANQLHTYGNAKIELLKKQNKQTKTFLNMVIHDMRNPTASIKMGLENAIHQIRDFLKLSDD